MREKTFSIIVTFGIMFIFWLFFSAWIVIIPQHYDLIELSKGIVSALIVTLVSHELLVPGKGESIRLKALRFVPYVVWEFWQIVMATLDVTYRVLHPKMPIDPQIIEFETTLRSGLSLTTLANSITLTPGTITVIVEPDKGKFVVHAIAKEPADSLLVDQTMQRKVAHVFMEG